MARSHGMLTLLLLLPLFLAAERQAPCQATIPQAAPSHLDGIWSVKLDPGAQFNSEDLSRFNSQFSRSKVVVVKSVGTEVQVSDPQTKKVFAGKALDARMLRFDLPAADEPSGKTKILILDRHLSGNTMSGTAKIDDFQVQWKAIRLPSAWECSNHKNPSHIATTEEEMRSLTMQYKCVGWHKLKAE